MLAVPEETEPASWFWMSSARPGPRRSRSPRRLLQACLQDTETEAEKGLQDGFQLPPVPAWQAPRGGTGVPLSPPARDGSSGQRTDWLNPPSEHVHAASARPPEAGNLGHAAF